MLQDKKFIFYSSIHLEKWNHLTPLTKGIGGSETSHIELAKRLLLNHNQVHSFIPLEPQLFLFEDNWVFDYKDFDSHKYTDNLVIVYRDPTFFDKELNPQNKYYFMAQDVDYDWTEERLSKIDKYICLCPVHAQYTKSKYPSLESKIILSSNGISSDRIIEIKEKIQHIRNPNKIVYTSSPDRGLLLILENWFRILEINPNAEFHFYYGFKNAEEIIKVNNNSELIYLQQQIAKLEKQKNVFNHGRLNQPDLIKELLTANVWFYPTDWPETSCISCMEAQACGAIPVTNKHWALKQNILGGFMFDGIPQQNARIKCEMFQQAGELTLPHNFQSTSILREEMEKEALEVFNWDVFVEQFEHLYSNAFMCNTVTQN